MKPAVYLETTIISYLAAPASANPLTASRQMLTRRWWQEERHKFRLVVSAAVLDECARGQPARIRARFDVLAEASSLTLTGSIMELAVKLVTPGGLPPTAAADAVHIAAATVWQIEYLLTWNMRHIANAGIRRVVERIIESNGYPRPVICTPEELFPMDTLAG